MIFTARERIPVSYRRSSFAGKVCACLLAAMTAAASGALAVKAAYAAGDARRIEAPASYEGELPGADSTILWHLDLLPLGRYQLRMTYVDKPAPNQFDELGRWEQDSRDRVELRSGTRRTHAYLAPQENGALLMLDRSGKPIEGAGHLAILARLPQPSLIEPSLELTGMFRYMADAASITLCADGGQLPVAMEGDYKALEEAYRKAGQKAGEPLLVSFEGSIAQRPSMEESQPPRSTVVVKRFLSQRPGGSCGGPVSASALRGTYWKLVRLNDVPTPAVSGRQEPHLIFARDKPRVSGSGGCNRISGAFDLDGDKLHLRGVASTMMACLAGMDIEQRFLQSLDKVESYRIAGSHLDLLDAAGSTIASFEAVALR